LSDALPSLPSACAPFVGEVAALLAESATLDGPAFTARALGLAVPSALAAPTWQTASAVPLTAALGGTASATAYAFRTLIAACDQAVKAGASAGGPTIDAPIPMPAAAGLWLEVLRRRLGRRDAVPGLLWTQGSEGRLLVTLGPPTSSALAYLANPRHRSARLWPLRTGIAGVAEQALASLTPGQRTVLGDADASLGDLALAFA
jgi:hypothetical protein